MLNFWIKAFFKKAVLAAAERTLIKLANTDYFKFFILLQIIHCNSNILITILSSKGQKGSIKYTSVGSGLRCMEYIING